MNDYLSQLRIYDDSHSTHISNLLPNVDQFLPVAQREIVAMFPMRLQWECTRAALSHGCNVFEMLPDELGNDDDYESVWNHISQPNSKAQTPLLEKSTSVAWGAAVDRFSGVSLRCKVTFNSKGSGPQYSIRLEPLQTDKDGSSRRFHRAFGSDRFLTMEISSPYNDQKSKDVTRQIGKKFSEWLLPFLLEEKLFLDRIWRVLFFCPRSRTGARRESYYEAKLFAIRGADAADGGSAAKHLSNIPTITLQQVLDWFIPLEKNKNRLSCKLYNRISLGFTKSYSTLVFSPPQVYEREDRYGDDSPEPTCFNDRALDWSSFADECNKSHVMNDGCSRISEAAANEIWRRQGGVGPAPSVLQGRILNTKGVWVKSIDSKLDNRDPIWIETTTSQRKFVAHAADRQSTTADEHRMSFALDRGVSMESIKHCILRQVDREKENFFEALNDPPSLLSWISQKLPNAENTDGSDQMQGSQSVSRVGRITRLLLAGFRPNSCSYLASLIQKAVKSWLDRLRDKLEIPIASSAFVIGIPDLKGVLNPGEIYLSFSRGSPDNQQPCLYDQNVLVSRYPMHRRSDVQKVRAVYRPELAYIQDAVVFSTRGRYPLAEKMSNGDYDGDSYLVCWDELLVKDFRNAPPPRPASPSKLNIEVDSQTLSECLEKGGIDNFLRKNFQLQLEHDVLGRCANYQENYSYQIKTISSPKLDRLADLRDLLVDAPKNGCRFSGDKWLPFLRDNGYPTGNAYPKSPAYKSHQNMPAGVQSTHIVDIMMFQVAIPAAEDFFSLVQKFFKEVTSTDHDLESLYTGRYHQACSFGDTRAKKEIEHLVDSLGCLVGGWKEARVSRRLEAYDDDIERAYVEYRSISPNDLAYPVIREWHQSQ